MTFYIGMSGWSYDGWREHFYPEGMRVKDELAYACSKVNSIEINGTFYRLQKPHVYKAWHDAAPKDFVYALKAPRYNTHIKRLKDPERGIANFFASGVLCLREKLGPILWQLPPFLPMKDDRFEKFFTLLPKTSTEAKEFMKEHSSFSHEESFVEEDFPLRHCIEVRHPSFAVPEFYSLCKEYGIALVRGHAPSDKVPEIHQVTAPFVYWRMHGNGLEKGYSKKQLEDFGAELAKLSADGTESYCYFDNKAKRFAPFNAMDLAASIMTRMAM